MSTPILATKLYVPPPRPKMVARPRLIERLDTGLHGKLTLISAPAGFGKTTLVSTWLAQGGVPATWLSLDAGDSEPSRFLTYLVAALQRIAPDVGAAVLAVLQSPQPPSPESVLTTLLNDLARVPERFVLVLDDYHAIDAPAIDQALAFLLDYLPPQAHVVITTREDPPLPLSRWRVRGELQELRVADLRFSAEEAAAFLNEVMGLALTADEIAALETRTEGWVAGLQLAALSMQGHQGDMGSFIRSFTGSHRFVLDYLLEEVLHQQPAPIQTFLLRTAVLNRLCGPLCDAVVGEQAAGDGAVGDGQATLEYLERANLFVVPLDNERRWYRYHHLFADLLRQRVTSLHGEGNAGEGHADGPSTATLHTRASQWFEENGLELEAFHHAVAADDVPRAARLVEGDGIPLHFRGAVAPVTKWIKSLPTEVLDATPMLWTALASATLAMGQPQGVPAALQAAERALMQAEQTVETRDLLGRVAAIRATLAAGMRQVETVLTESQRALELLRPDNAAFRVFTIWKLGFAYHVRGEREAAMNAYHEAIEASTATGNHVTTILATIGLASIQERDNLLQAAAENFRRAMEMVADLPLPVASEAYLGLAHIHYAWNELEVAREYAARITQMENNDRLGSSQLLLAKLKLVQGDVTGAAELVAAADRFTRERKLMHRVPEVVAAQVLVLLRQGKVDDAAEIVQAHNVPLSQARVLLAQGEAVAAREVLAPQRAPSDRQGWLDDVLHAHVLAALAEQALGNVDAALATLGEAFTLAAPGGYVRLFIDEGAPMAELLQVAAERGMMPEYVAMLRTAWAADEAMRAAATPALIPPPVVMPALPQPTLVQAGVPQPVAAPPQAQVQSSASPPPDPLVEPLSARELEVLQLTAEGLSNREIGERLFLALSTVKGHNRNIFGKLQVQRRTEAVARARDLGLL